MIDCVNALSPQVDLIALVVTTDVQDSTWWALRKPPAGILIVPDMGEVNISRWWNRGLDVLATTPALKWDVAILNDDVIVPPGWFDAVSSKMREMNCAAACSGGPLPMPELYTHVGPVPGISNVLQGFAFMVAGELGLRANEDIPWYFSDNYMDWESRRLGGTLVIPGHNVQHLFPNGQMTAEMYELNAQGAQAFADFYGGLRPW